MVAAAKRFKFGWFGDGGHGEQAIQMILAGRKTASASLAYEAEGADMKVGETLDLVDKRDRSHGKVVIISIEIRLFGDLDESLAHACGLSLPELREKIRFANAREPRSDEELRVTHFRLNSPAR